MATKIVCITAGIGELAGKTPEEIITYVARVSNPQNQKSYESAPKLLKYCLRNKHFSIFETVSFTVEITTSRAIATQLLRHRSFFFQQFSARYSESTDYIVCEARSQDTKNRQNSIDNVSEVDKAWFRHAQQKIWNDAYMLYKKALDTGIAKECARFLLPMNTKTTLYMTGSVRSWIHFIEVRSDSSAQKEIRDIAANIKQIFVQHFPHVAEALDF